MANQSPVPSRDGDDATEGVSIPSLPPSGPRKLVRPSLPPGLLNRRSFKQREAPLSTHQYPAHAPGSGRSGNASAESFYLQKQMQGQTQMVFILEGGDRAEGVIEWYDAQAIKIRHGHVRTLIYKSAIKYLHKANDDQH